MAERSLVVDPEDAAGVADVDAEITGRRVVEAQFLRLPPAWRHADRIVIEGTHVALFAIGMVFTLMITLEVVSRYVFSFSISFVNALARLLLVWFFLLGAGIALRRGAHVGFELLLSKMKERTRKAFILFGLALAAIFYLQIIWSGWHALGPARTQTEAGLDLSLVWVVAAIPVGCALLLYHTIVLMWIEVKRNTAEGGRP
ncbi:MAG TPA: TRAP transporter small permease [Casimicrobiaceae bacterium]